MAIAHEQSAGAVAAASAGTIAVTLAGAVTAGRLIVVGVGNNAAQTVSGVADTLLNTYVQAVTNGAATQRVSIWYARNILGGAAPTITATFSANSADRRIVGAEYSGAETASTVLDGSNSRVNPSQDPVTSNAVTASLDGCLYVGVMSPNSSAVDPVAPLNSFLERFENSGVDGWQYEDRVQVTAASLEASWDLTVADDATGVVAVFQPASASVVSTGSLLRYGRGI